MKLSHVLALGLLAVLAGSATASRSLQQSRAAQLAAAHEQEQSKARIELPALKEFLPPMEDVDLPPLNDFMAKTGLPQWDELGLPPMDELLKATQNGKVSVTEAIKKADALMTQVVYEMLPPEMRAIVKKGQGKKSFWGMPKLNLTEAAQNFNKKFPGFVDAANKYNFTEAITKFNVSEAAAKYNVKLPPGLQNVKLPAAPADLSKYEALFKSALNRLPELGAGNLNITQQLSKAAPPLEEVVKAVNAASQLASALPKDKMPNMEQVMGGLNTLGSKIKTAADKLPSKQGAAAAPAPTVPRPTAAA